MQGGKIVQAKKSIHFDRIKRPNYGHGSGEQYFLSEVG